MRWRIASAYIVLIVSTLALLALILIQLLRATYVRTLEAGLAGQARLVATITGDPTATFATLDTTVNQLHDQLGARVTLIAADGTVLADSFQSPAANGKLLDRPEVRDALALGQGASERNSTATGDEMFYVAVPFGPLGKPSGVARVGVPLTMIAQAQTRLGLTVLVTALLAAAITLVLAVLIARRTTRPLLELRSMAARLAGGDLEVQVPIPPDEEVAALAQDFNLMASRLRQLLAAIETERGRLSTILATMADGILLLGPNASVTLIESCCGTAGRRLQRRAAGRTCGPAHRFGAACGSASARPAFERGQIDRGGGSACAHDPALAARGRDPRADAGARSDADRLAGSHRPSPRGRGAPRLPGEYLARSAHATRVAAGDDRNAPRWGA